MSTADAMAAFARDQDAEDPLRHLREEFIVPSREDLKSQKLSQSQDGQECTYLCGNSLGLQPKRTSEYVNTHLRLWGSKGVFGHFKEVEDSVIPPWLHLDDAVTEQSAKIVGALQSEVAIMQTLTANIHLLMASFYRPTKDRYKIILEGKAFPSDHYVVESQLRHHALDPSNAMILIEPPSPSSPTIPTSHILSIIDAHASDTALLLLPGIQFYTGQLFDIQTITAHAQSKGIIVGWDLAHAAGNVPLQMHDWNVDFAAWCNYKYMNCGPGAIGGLFVHERHTRVDIASTDTDNTASTPENPGAEATTTATPLESGEQLHYRPRLSGWWGSTKASRFAMTNQFVPIAGAGGFQLSNPSALDMAAVLASLSVFAMTDMQSLRRKSLKLTGYLGRLLDEAAAGFGDAQRPWEIITPRDEGQRGAQLSVRLRTGLLDGVMRHLEEVGVVVDERKPDVIRIAPAPLYNTWSDVSRAVEQLKKGCRMVMEGEQTSHGSVMHEGGRQAKGWSEVK